MTETFYSTRDSEGLQVTLTDSSVEDFVNEYMMVVYDGERHSENLRFERLDYDFQEGEEGNIALAKFYIATVQSDYLVVAQLFRIRDSLRYNPESGGWEFSHAETVAATFRGKDIKSIRSYGTDLRNQ